MKRNSNLLTVVLAFCLALGAKVKAAPAFPLSSNDVVAFVGGADVCAAQEGGQLESLLSCAYPGARFRNFGWEGDTVYAQPRDIGFPTLAEHLRKAGVTVIIAQFGRGEALSGETNHFRTAYESLLADWVKIAPRMALVIPPPFEKAGGLLPDLEKNNRRLSGYAREISEIAQQENFTCVDLFSKSPPSHLTDDGLQLTSAGQAICGVAFAREIGLGVCSDLAQDPDRDGKWTNPKFEKLRQAIVLKNRYWFSYWRPQNWAFLGGDRTEQPSSRDYRDPTIRWFPKEIERFQDLIEVQEKKIQELAQGLKGKPETKSPEGKQERSR